MKKLQFLLIIFTLNFTFAQQNPEVYILDVFPAYEGLQLLNLHNIANDNGYDNQPSFASDEIVYFAGNNKGQTDIATYNLNTKSKKWLNQKTPGSEYSPQKFPTTNNVAAVRLDKDGLQRLYTYNSKTGIATKAIENIQVAYFAFYNDEKMLATVLDGEKMDLVLLNLSSKTTDTLFYNAGRSLQKVPKTNAMSYTLVNEAGNLDLYLLEMETSESFFITELPIGIQDYVWINDTQILVGSGSKLYLYDTLGMSEWNRVASLEEYGIKNISRMAISPNGKKLAVVAEKR
ncbi:hypothetical protein [Aequorivita sp. Q41]|uniref:hypothetical protein n=1 Tax=Aequorivita sp. Q41 TaxID=3153300 RepID=UPI0032425D52